jgi:hypothetical protein
LPPYGAASSAFADALAANPTNVRADVFVSLICDARDLPETGRTHRSATLAHHAWSRTSAAPEMRRIGQVTSSRSVAKFGGAGDPTNHVILGGQGLGKESVGLFHNFYSRWEVRHCRLTCPHCKMPASPPTFRQGRYMRGDLALVCERCNESNPVTFWRFEGIEKPCPSKSATIAAQDEAGLGLG